jgi:hypothetical protein
VSGSPHHPLHLRQDVKKLGPGHLPPGSNWTGYRHLEARLIRRVVEVGTAVSARNVILPDSHRFHPEYRILPSALSEGTSSAEEIRSRRMLAMGNVCACSNGAPGVFPLVATLLELPAVTASSITSHVLNIQPYRVLTSISLLDVLVKPIMFMALAANGFAAKGMRP